MSYKRTEEVKEKQRKKMKEKVLEYNWDEILEKRKITLKNNGTKVGRKKGDGPVKTGVEKPCVVCSTMFYVTHSQKDTKRVCSRKCLYCDPVYIEKLKNIDRSYMKSESYAAATRNPNTSKYKQYQREVFKLTEENYAKNIDVINPNRYPRTLAGVEGGYQLDHIKSIKYGFDNNINPSIIADITNLQMLPWIDNVKKGR